jgi:hypothetical protein
VNFREQDPFAVPLFSSSIRLFRDLPSRNREGRVRGWRGQGEIRTPGFPLNSWHIGTYA